MSHVLVLGGDGYLGWPAAMYFSASGHQVTVVDNFFRRKACVDLGVGMLYSVPSLIERAKIWYELTGNEIKVVIGDLALPSTMRELFSGEVLYDWAIDKKFTGLPETVVHFAEQPSAPYSSIDHWHADFTLVNNLRVTNNLLWAVRDFSKETHIIKLGTMGEYGTPNIDIEEGWLEIEHNGRADRFLFPRQAGSLYHTTKIMDTDLMWFGVRMWDLRVTDLMQGPVYGIETDESLIDSRLKTIFNYDEIFGTVINRFLAQAVVGYPLTVYGAGGQTRGYINIKDTLQCLGVSAKNPPAPGSMDIFNQITETFSVNELANLTKNAGKKIGITVRIESIPNPRKEQEQHYYNPKFQGLSALGVNPSLLTEDLMISLLSTIQAHKESINKRVFFKGISW